MFQESPDKPDSPENLPTTIAIGLRRKAMRRGQLQMLITHQQQAGSVKGHTLADVREDHLQHFRQAQRARQSAAGSSTFYRVLTGS